jgi:hypothetical protein
MAGRLLAGFGKETAPHPYVSALAGVTGKQLAPEGAFIVISSATGASGLPA